MTAPAETLDELLLGWSEIQNFADRKGSTYERAVVTMVNRGLTWTDEQSDKW